MIGFAVCGSFCTHARALETIGQLKRRGYEILPILSEKVQETDTRFGKAEDFIRHTEELCGRRAVMSIEQAEPLGPAIPLDALIIAPCTGNTLAKLANGITDTCVLMAAKAHLRNQRPLVIGVSTNDGLSASLENIGALMNRKNVYFMPFYQDDSANKPSSLICNMSLAQQVLDEAMMGRQYQPVLDLRR